MHCPKHLCKNRERGAIYSVIASTFLKNISVLQSNKLNKLFSFTSLFHYHWTKITILTDKKKKKNKDTNQYFIMIFRLMFSSSEDLKSTTVTLINHDFVMSISNWSINRWIIPIPSGVTDWQSMHLTLPK